MGQQGLNKKNKNKKKNNNSSKLLTDFPSRKSVKTGNIQKLHLPYQITATGMLIHTGALKLQNSGENMKKNFLHLYYTSKKARALPRLPILFLPILQFQFFANVAQSKSLDS